MNAPLTKTSYSFLVSPIVYTSSIYKSSKIVNHSERQGDGSFLLTSETPRVSGSVLVENFFTADAQKVVSENRPQ